MSKVSDRVLSFIAGAAEDAFWEALGLASKGGAYEPAVSDEVRLIKTNHTSKVEVIFNKLMK